LQFTPRQSKRAAKISSFLWKPPKEERQLSARLELRSVKWLNQAPSQVEAASVDESEEKNAETLNKTNAVRPKQRMAVSV